MLLLPNDIYWSLAKKSFLFEMKHIGLFNEALKTNTCSVIPRRRLGFLPEPVMYGKLPNIGKRGGPGGKLSGFLVRMKNQMPKMTTNVKMRIIIVVQEKLRL